jgi:general secretion pathway protein J
VAADDAGFTLVEMLVAVTLLGLAGAMIVEGLAVGQHLWRTETVLATQGEAVEAAQTLLRDRIERLRPITRFQEGKPHADLDGEADTFDFLALAPDAERPASLRRYDLSMSDDGDLVLDAAPWRGGDERRQVLLHHVESLELAYFGATREDPQPQWRPSWSGQTEPPRLVRVRLTFGDADRRVWPDLIVQPAATADSACEVDADTGACRGRP